MHNRTILGPADVTDDELTKLVAALLHEPPERVTVLDSAAEEVDYDLPTITTAGRYWVTGNAIVGDRRQQFRLFVKHVQSWARSPEFAQVPAEIADIAEAGVPWRTEPAAYRSDLGDRLPDGLRMPRAVGVFDLDEKSASIWMETFTPLPVAWDLDRFASAAHLLGRLAASSRVNERADLGETDLSVRHYLQTRLRFQVFPLLLSEDIWQHPMVAGAFDATLRARLQATAARAEALVDELELLPVGTAHGDACPNNILITAEHDGFVLIDYGFWAEGPIGFDLGQLLVGDIQIGKRDVALLQATEDAILPAYIKGLRAEGFETTDAAVRRAHALQLMLYTGFSAIPMEHLSAGLTPALLRMAAERATIATFCLDLLDRTEPALPEE